MRKIETARTGTIRNQLVFLMCLLVILGWSLFTIPATSSISIFALGLLLTLLVLFSGVFLVMHEFPETLGAEDEKKTNRKS